MVYLYVYIRYGYRSILNTRREINKGELLFKRYVVYGYTFLLQIENMELDLPVSLMFFQINLFIKSSFI